MLQFLYFDHISAKYADCSNNLVKTGPAWTLAVVSWAEHPEIQKPVIISSNYLSLIVSGPGSAGTAGSPRSRRLCPTSRLQLK